MRKFLTVTVFVVAVLTVTSAASKAQTYGPGYMMGPGYGSGYGHGYMMGPGYGSGYRHGPGMMYGYDSDNDDRGSRRGRNYRRQRMCWNETNSSHGYGYYAPCRR